MSEPEVWLRGPIPGITPFLQPVAHALLQAREDVARVGGTLTLDELWARPGGAASAGFHMQHLAGSLDRLLTYARAEPLSELQRQALVREKEVQNPPPDAAMLVKGALEAIDQAVEQIRNTPEQTLLESRKVGRAGLPSTVIGLLFHSAEHTTRHVGQLITTTKIVSG